MGVVVAVFQNPSSVLSFEERLEILIDNSTINDNDDYSAKHHQ
jgi:hypothetical protein